LPLATFIISIFVGISIMDGAVVQAKEAVAALGALAHETRLALFRLLVQTGPAGLPAGIVAERLGVPPSSLSFHLQQLVHAGLISQRRVSRQIIYAVDYEAMNGLMVYLTENCCGGDTAAGVTCAPDREPGIIPPAPAAAVPDGGGRRR
jgi:ArsR family transcriptional regulator, arsenate/arsenite/antimonite-responsive transcriptional repressor